MKYLIVIDCQKDFISGSLANKDAQNIYPNILNKISAAQKENKNIIYTKDTHTKNYLNTLEGKKLPIEHCIENSAGWELEKGIVLNKKDIVICKPNFGYTNWFKYINDPDEIEIIGLVTDICVISNALILKATFPETEIIVDSSCCAGLTPEKHAAALEVMKSCQITVI